MWFVGSGVLRVCVRRLPCAALLAGLLFVHSQTFQRAGLKKPGTVSRKNTVHRQRHEDMGACEGTGGVHRSLVYTIAHLKDILKSACDDVKKWRK